MTTPSMKRISKWMDKTFGEGNWTVEEDEEEVVMVGKKTRKVKKVDPGQGELF